MAEERTFPEGTTVRHFKRLELTKEQLLQEPNMYLYRVIGVAENTEDGGKLMVYRPLYGEGKLYARPLDMFLSAVDREKYPDAKQAYRFEVEEN